MDNIQKQYDDMNSWIDWQIDLIRGHDKPITLGSDQWEKILDKATSIQTEALEKFNLFDEFVDTHTDTKGDIYYVSNEDGSALYYSIEDRLLNKFKVID